MIGPWGLLIQVYFDVFTAPSITASVAIRPCPKCGEKMTLKTKKDGSGYFLSCSGYPACRNAVWFPSFVLEVEPTEQICREVRHI